jgi:tetratricopeptide (TPR) repeat protein
MANKGISPNEVTFTSLINKAPDFETGKAFLEEMATKGIKPNEVTFTTLIKLTKSDPQSAINHFFENYQYDFLEYFDNKFITSFFEYFDYIAFIQKYFSTIINTNDNIIFHYAVTLEKQHTEKDRDLALSLLKNIKDKNSNYYNILANLYRDISTEKAIELYKEAAKLEAQEKNKAKYYHNIASLIYEQNLIDKFETAIEYCNKALECNKNFDYSKKLLTFLTVICIQESQFIGEINILIKRFGYNKVKILREIINELKKHNKMENKIELLINEIKALN